MLPIERPEEMKDSTKVTDARRPGWFWMHDQIVDDYGDRLGRTGLALYAILARRANADGECWPGIRLLAKTLRMSPNTVLSHLRRLEDLGLISITRETDANGQHMSNTYRLLDPPPVGGVYQPLIHPPLGGGVSTTDTGVSTTDTGVYQPSRQGVSAIATEGLHIKDYTIKDERTFSEIWTIALSQLRGQMTKATWETWLKGTTARHDGDTLTVIVANEYAKEWLSMRLDKIVERTVTSIDPAITTIAYAVRNGAIP